MSKAYVRIHQFKDVPVKSGLYAWVRLAPHGNSSKCECGGNPITCYNKVWEMDASKIDQKTAVEIILKQDQILIGSSEIAMVLLPVSWFQPECVTRQWFPMKGSANKPSNVMVEIEVHITSSGARAFQAPYAQLLVRPAWEQGYPPQQGLPPQGYPPQQGLPPQGYPPQPSYPPQGYPPQPNYPPQGYPPQQGLPPQGYPPQPSYPPQGYPPQQGLPQQGYPPQPSYPPQGYPPQQGLPPQGYPPQQGLPPQGYPPQQGFAPQGYPPQYSPQQNPYADNTYPPQPAPEEKPTNNMYPGQVPTNPPSYPSI